MGNVTAKTSGDIASFMTPAETNIKSLKVHFSPKQLGEGDPSPDNVREIVGWDGVEVNGCGKNLVPWISTRYICKSNYYNGNADWSDPWKIPDRTKQYTYSVFIDNTNGENTCCSKIWFKNEDNTGFVDGSASPSIEKVPVGSCKRIYKTVIAKENTYYFVFGLELYKGCVASNPIVYESDQGTTIPIDFTNNYLNKVQITNNKTINSTGEEITESGMSITDYISVNENEKWVLSFISTATARTRRFWGYDENKQIVSELAKISWANIDQEYTLTTTITNDIKYIRVCYYTNDTDLLLTIDGTSFKNVYGGYVDLISGELVETHNIITFDGSDDELITHSSNFNDWIQLSGIPNMKKGSFFSDNSSVSNRAKKVSSSSNKNELQILIGADNSKVYIYNVARLDSTVTTDETLRNWFLNNPITFTYPLATPITHQLTPTQLQSFIGQNNFWSNADYIEIEYELKETEDIQKARKKIILNQPQLKSISDKIASFNTDMVAPLKNCKIYFNPIQLGSGDPSPTNVRNINGWTGIDSYVNGDKVSVDWTNDIGTVYGGYVDLVKGELIAEWELAQGKWGDIKSSTPNSTTGFYQGVLHYNNTIIVCHYQKDYYINTVCNIINTILWKTAEGTPEHYYGGNHSTNKGIMYIYGNFDDDLVIQIAAKLATPIHYQLTPQQLLTFKSTNHIWSETNGQQIDVKYWTHKNLTPTPLTNYIENQTWTDSAYISSSGKKTTNTVSASHFLTNQILLEAGTYVLSGFSHYVGTDNTNFRIHAYDSTGKWLRQITFQQIGNLSPVDISFTLDTDTYVNVSIAMDFDGVLAKIN